MEAKRRTGGGWNNRIDRLPGEEYGQGFARSVQTLNSELPDSMICIMYRGSGSRGVQISDSELPESIIRIMFRGSGLGDVQNSNSEHLRGTKYHKIYRKEAKGGKQRGWAGESGGRAEL